LATGHPRGVCRACENLERDLEFIEHDALILKKLVKAFADLPPMIGSTVCDQPETPFIVMDSDLDESLQKDELIECPNCGEEHQIKLAKNAEGVETNRLMFVYCGGKSFCVGIMVGD
jgi:DNA-directed RNA polymerase subunit RPC12/RpoP